MTDITMPSKLEVAHLLYDDETGKAADIEVVQALDPIPLERIPRLRMLLSHEDLFVVFQAAKVLTAWADPVGLNALEALIDQRVHRVMEFSPHRIYGYDNVYDELAEALDGYRTRSHEEAAQRRRIFEKLLELYGPCDYQGQLKKALMAQEFPELQVAIEAAIGRAKGCGKAYLASQLLSPLAVTNPTRAVQRFSEFSGLRAGSPNPEVNVAEALRYIEPDISLPWLERLTKHRDKVVANEAKQSLAALGSRSARSPS